MMDKGRDGKGKFVKGSKVNQGRIPSLIQRQKQAEAMMGRVESDEHKAKIRSGLLASGKTIGRPKGGTPWNKGMKRVNGDLISSKTPMSHEGRQRVSEASSKRMKGMRIAPETEFKKGMIPWNKGKSLSPEMIEKLRMSHKNITEETRYKMSIAKKGKQHSSEVIRKMLTRRTPTSLEMKFLGIIEKNRLPYKFVGDGSFMIGRKNPDFININGDKIAVEVYARYYKLKHAETIQAWKNDRQRVFKEYGWDIIFFDETQVNENNILKQLGGN